MYRTLAILLCLPLTSCILAEAGGASLAVEGAVVEGGAAGAMAMGEAEAVGAAGRLMIAPEAASAAEAAFGPAIEELAAGRGALVVDSQGMIYAGSRAVASLEGETLFSEGRAIGELRDGYLYRTGGYDAVGRLHGSIPARGVTLTFADGTVVPNLRPMLVDVLRFDQGQYLIRLADSSQAWVPAAMVGLVIMAADEAGKCDPDRGQGVLVRPSGEPVSFTQCEAQDDVLVLQTNDGPVVVAPDQAPEILYGPSEVRFADALVGRTEVADAKSSVQL